LLKETTGAFEGPQTHDCLTTSPLTLLTDSWYVNWYCGSSKHNTSSYRLHHL